MAKRIGVVVGSVGVKLMDGKRAPPTLLTRPGAPRSCQSLSVSPLWCEAVQLTATAPHMTSYTEYAWSGERQERCEVQQMKLTMHVESTLRVAVSTDWAPDESE